jgi:hypothetical protein
MHVELLFENSANKPAVLIVGLASAGTTGDPSSRASKRARAAGL